MENICIIIIGDICECIAEYVPMSTNEATANIFDNPIMFYFATTVLGSFVLSLLARIISPKTKDIDLLKRQFNAYKELYHNIVKNNLYLEIKKEQADKYLKKFRKQLLSNRDFSMLFSQNVIRRFNDYYNNGMKTNSKRLDLNTRVDFEFNKMKRILGYPSDLSYTQVILLAIVASTWLLTLIAFVFFTIELFRNFEPISFTLAAFTLLILILIGRKLFIISKDFALFK